MASLGGGPLSRGRWLRVNISEKQAGTPLFDHIWAWKADQDNPSGVATLVKFFFQLARELDDGTIKKVVFDRSTAAPRHHLSFSSPAAGAQRSYRRRSEKDNRSVQLFGDGQQGGSVGSVELVARDNENIVCGLFYSGMEEQEANAFVEEIMRSFSTNFTSLMKDLSPKFAAAAKNKEESAVDLSYIPQFAHFSEVLNKLRDSMPAGDGGGINTSLLPP